MPTYGKPKLDTRKVNQYGGDKLGHHETPSGEYATDGCRIYYNCPESELPDYLREHTGAADTPWRITPDFIRWVKCVAKICPSGYVRMNGRYSIESGYRSTFDYVSAEYREAPPVHGDTTGFRPDFLRDAIGYVTPSKGGTIKVAWPKENGPMYLSNGERNVVVMPAKLPN